MNNRAKLIALVLLSFAFGAFTTVNFLGKFDRSEVQSAAKIIGLEMTDVEIDSLLPDLENHLEDYQNNRKLAIPNSVSPALVFNPIPEGFEMEKEGGSSQFAILKDVKLPENKEDLAFYSVRELAQLIKTQQLSSVDLTEFFLSRLKKYDPQLHCVITLTEDLAMEQAKRADAEIAAGKYRGLLHGIPYGAKDLLATKRYKTTWGAMPYKDQAFDYDAAVIQKLEEAGAVLIGKLTLGALAWGDVWYGEKTRNPWDTASGSSGSSAGSASAVSAGLVPFAIGTETLGSIVSPSTVCGTTGLRPTFGRVSRYGAMALSWSMDKIGPICRSAEDCAVILDIINGPDARDPSTIDAAFAYESNQKNKRGKVGYVKSEFERDHNFKEQGQATLKQLEAMGYELVPIDLPELPDLGIILEAEAAAAFDELTRSGQDDLLVRQIRNAWPNVFRAARFIPAVEYIQANRLRTQLIAEVNKVFQEVDALVHPSWATSALSMFNYTGHPSICIPNGFKDGKPTSITISGRLFGESRIVGVAQAYQEATDFDDQHPMLK